MHGTGQDLPDRSAFREFQDGVRGSHHLRAARVKSEVARAGIPPLQGSLLIHGIMAVEVCGCGVDTA